MESQPPSSSAERTPRLLVGAGVSAGATGLLASSCCALPMALAGFGMTSVAGALIPMLATLRMPMLILAACLVVAAWLGLRRGRRACASSSACATPTVASRLVVAFLLLTSGMVLLAIVWPSWIEPHAIRWVR